MKNFLLITKMPEVAEKLIQLFPDSQIHCFPKIGHSMEYRKEKKIELLFLDISELILFVEEKNYMVLEVGIKAIKRALPCVPIIVLTDKLHIRSTVNAVKSGAYDYLEYPIQPDELSLVISSLGDEQQRDAELDYLRDQTWNIDSDEIVKTKSKRMKDVFDKVNSVALTSSTVLLTGETGVGKSLIAKLLHQQSMRSDQQFISVHCGAIAENLIESELFGHEKGAFTGAIKKKIGKFEMAHKGTIFLDEVGTLSPSAQIKLLQVIQESCFQRVGGESDVRVDIRIISATNENLEDLCREKRFRYDLFYRLNVFPIHICPLTNRTEDIPSLIDFFIRKLNKTHLKNILGVDDSTIRVLQTYSWPGNIRELENLVERAYILEKSQRLTLESFPSDLSQASNRSAVLPINTNQTLGEVRHRVVEDIERQYLKELLTLHRGSIQKTSEGAGLCVRQIHKLMHKYGLDKNDFKAHQPLVSCLD